MSAAGRTASRRPVRLGGGDLDGEFVASPVAELDEGPIFLEIFHEAGAIALVDLLDGGVDEETFELVEGGLADAVLERLTWYLLMAQALRPRVSHCLVSELSSPMNSPMVEAMLVWASGAALSLM